MRILGVHSGHDSSAALIVDGKIVADVAEERFSRIKHDAGLPLRSIDYCLKSQGITMAEVDMIAVPATSPLPVMNHVFDLKGERQEKLPFKQAAIEKRNLLEEFECRRRVFEQVLVAIDGEVVVVGIDAVDFFFSYEAPAAGDVPVHFGVEGGKEEVLQDGLVVVSL